MGPVIRLVAWVLLVGCVVAWLGAVASPDGRYGLQAQSASGAAADAASGRRVAQHILRQPALSPDGEWLAFIYDGDIWRVPSAGGTAIRLTSTVANEQRPVYSPDGKWIAFSSLKHGGYDIYVMPSEGGVSRRVTFHGASEIPFGWTPDSSCILYESSQLGSGVDMWCVRLAGGEPWPISSGGFGQNEIQSAISPDGKRIAYVGNGRSTGYRQRGYSGSSSNDIWMCDFDGVMTSNHRKWVYSDANECFPVWLDNENVAYVGFGGTKSPHESGKVAFLFEGKASTPGDGFPVGFEDIREPNVAPRASKLVYTTGEREGWHLKLHDFKTKQTIVPNIQINTDVRTGETVATDLTSPSQIAPSPDGKLVAFVAGHDVWVMAADAPGGAVRQVTDTVAREKDIQWTPDSRSLVYSSRRTGQWQLYLADLSAKTERALAVVHGGVVAPSMLHDGSAVIACAGDKRLVRIPLGDGEVTTLLEANFHGAAHWGRPHMISPDGKWAVYTAPNSKLHNQVMVAELEIGKVTRISRLFDHCRNVDFSADGKRIVFSNSGEADLDIYAIDLVPQPDQFDEDKLEKAIAEVVKPAAPSSRTPAGERPAAPPVTTIDFTNISDRVRRVTSTVGSEGSPLGLSDGKTILYFGSSERSQQIMSVTFERGRPSAPRALTTSATPKGNLALSADGKDLWFTDGGVMNRIKTTGGAATAFPFRVRQTRTAKELREEAFRECVWIIGDYFYDADMHGVNWSEMAARYMEAMHATPTGDEWGGLMNELLGELNSSHQGFTAVDPRSDGFRESPATLGLELEARGLRDGTYLITKALKRGPCDPVLVGALEGQYLVGVDGVPFKAGETVLARLLEGTAGKRVRLHVNGTPEFEGSRVVAVRPTGQGADSNLYYHAWVDAQRAMVEKLSDGKLGYAHIRGMNQEAVRQFKRDLGDALEGKKGAVIDVRYNGGGNTAVNLLEILVKRPWVVRTDRSGESATENESRSVAMEIPSCLMINQASFSNAEMIAEGYKQLGIGPVVGWPTGGAVIWTTSARLIDGSSIRLPFAKVSTVDGENLENIGRQPDIKVENPRELLEQGRDPQTEAAVAELLKKVGG